MFKNSKEKELIFFFIKLFLIWLSWKGFIYIIGEEKIPLDKRFFPVISAVWDNFNLNIVKFLVSQTESILNLIGYTSYSHERLVWIEGYNGIAIGNYCIGMQLMYYFAMLVVVSEISFKNKLIAVPVGILITQTLNIFRLVGLSLVTVYLPNMIFLFHDHIFNIIVFGTLISYYYLLTKN